VRIDLNGLDFKGTDKGNYSIVLKGKDSECPGKLLLIDKMNKTVESFFSEASEEKIDKKTNEMLENRSYVSKTEETEVSLIQVCDKGGPVVKMIESCECNKFIAEYKMITKQIKQQHLNLFYEITSFNDYFEMAKSYFNSDKEKVEKDLVGNKTYKAVLYVSNKFPLKYNQFLPLLHILGYVSPHIAKISEFLSQNQLFNIGFPLKATIPVFFTVDAHITLKKFEIKTPETTFMNIDKDYISSLITYNHPEHTEILYKPINILPLESSESVEGTPIERITWSSQESEGNEFLIQAEKQFQNLLEQPKTPEDTLYLNSDNIEESKEEAIGELKELGLSTNVMKNFAYHCSLDMKTIDYINRIKGPLLIKRQSISKRTYKSAENVNGTFSSSLNRIRSSKKLEGSSSTKLEIKRKEILHKFKNFLSTSSLQKKFSDVDIRLGY